PLDPTSFFVKKLGKKLYSFFTQFPPRRKYRDYRSLSRVSPVGVAHTHKLFCKKAWQKTLLLLHCLSLAAQP
ncbi:MAG: hypothetical protein ACI4GY_00430, partial [Acutalibacteraceae bacterium]